MKKILILALAVALVVGAVVLSERHYSSYQTQQNQAKQAIVDKQVAEIKAAQVAHTALVDQYNAMRVECEKGQAAYDQLTVALKAKTPRPACGPVIAR